MRDKIGLEASADFLPGRISPTTSMQGFADSTDETSRFRDASIRALPDDDEDRDEGLGEEGLGEEDAGHGLDDSTHDVPMSRTSLTRPTATGGAAKGGRYASSRGRAAPGKSPAVSKSGNGSAALNSVKAVRRLVGGQVGLFCHLSRSLLPSE